MGDFGLKISRAGDDVKTTDDLDLAYTSKFSTLKFYRWGNLSLTTNGSGDGSVTYNHDLGYAPAHRVFRKGTAQFTYLDASSYTNSFFPLGAANVFSSGVLHQAFKTYSDDDNLVITATGAGASTTYDFRFYLLVDLAQAFSGDDNVGVLKDYGFKVSQEGFSVLTAKEYQLSHSSKYKSIQYYPQNIYSQALSLPAFFASPLDTFVEAGTYVDFNHDLGYAPFFLAYNEFTIGGSDRIRSIPFNTENAIDVVNYSVAGFADATRVRLYFYEASQYATGTLYDNFPATTITTKCFVFTENLAGSENK